MRELKTVEKSQTEGELKKRLKQKVVEIQYEPSEELVPALLSSSQSVFYIVQDRKFKVVTPQLCKLTKLSQKELLAKNPLSIVHPNDRAMVREKAVKMLKGEQSEPYEFRFLDNDGKTKYAKEVVTSIIYKGKLSTLGNWIDLTERRQVEEELRMSEEKYRHLFDNLNDAAFLADNQTGIIIETNRQGAALLGRSRSEIIGMHQSQFHPPEKAEEYRLRFNTHISKGHDADYDGEVIRKDGKIVPVTISASTLTIHGQSLLLGLFHDITKRKQTEDALQEISRFNTSLLSNAPNPITVISPDTSIRYISPSFEKLTGFAGAEVIGLKAPYPWWPEESREEFESLLMKDMERGSNLIERQLQKKNGERFWVEFNVVSVNHNGTLEYLLLSWVDITERKQAETALKESEEKFSVTFRSSPEMIAVSNMKEGKYIEVNDSYTRTTGYRREELIGHPVGEINMFVDPEDADKMARLMQEQGKIRNEEYKFRMKSGEIRNWLCSAEVITIGGDPCSIAVATDITERKIMEDELRKHRDHLEELVHKRTIELESLNSQLARELTERERIEGELRIAIKNADAANKAKSEFLARMSHEIRTPIHGVMGTLDLLRDTELGQEQQQYVNMSKASAETLLNVVNDILDFSKIEAGKVELEKKDFDLRTLLEETLETMAVPAHKKGLEVMLQISRGVPVALTGDAGRMRQVLVNLLGNAIKFTEQGEIVLRVDIESESEKDIELHFSVRDTGIGIPKDKQELLFHPFEQVDGSMNRKYGGSRLGLSICKQLLDMMNGHIWFTSWPGEGSIFNFTVKCSKQAVVVGVDSVPGILSNLQEMPLLLVDDNATCRSILKDLLNEWGFQITEAENGRSALKESEDSRGTSRQFRIILMDKTMPTVNGFTAAEQILRNSTVKPGIVMMLPADSINDDFARCQELGMSYYLVKPVKKNELLKVILAASGQAKTVPEPGNQSASASTGIDAPHLRILVAEDNTTSQVIAKKALEKAGHTAQIAGTGLEAIRLLKEGAFDMVLMDVEMPEMNGLEATRLIRKTEHGSGKHIPVLAMTAYAMKEDRQRCLEAGMDAYLSKPVNLDELHKIIRHFSSVKDTRPAIVDIEAALKFIGGDRDVLKEVVYVFLNEDYPEQLKRLRDGIGQHDARTVKAAAHSIKGAVRSLGGTAPGDIAFKLEEMGRNNDLTKAEAAVQELELEVKLFTDFYAKYNW